MIIGTILTMLMIIGTILTVTTTVVTTTPSMVLITPTDGNSMKMAKSTMKHISAFALHILCALFTSSIFMQSSPITASINKDVLTLDNGLNLMTWNSTGIMSSSTHLGEVLSVYSVHICGVSDHWLYRKDMDLHFLQSINNNYK